jgi:hypothetical protein
MSLFSGGASVCASFIGVNRQTKGDIARCYVTFDLFPRSRVGPLVLNAPRSRSFTAPTRSHRRGSVEYGIPTPERENEYQDLFLLAT